jgi:hypothetical protein
MPRIVGAFLALLVAMLAGLVIAIFGFLVMRNPMRLSIFAPTEEGYYQRMVLDASPRNTFRVLGMLICMFGAGIATAVLGGAFKVRALQAMSKGLWASMGLLFLAYWCFGIALTIWQALRGKSVGWSDWRQSRRRAIELGAIDVFPSVTPQMQREALMFTVGLFVLFFVAAGAALTR